MLAIVANYENIRMMKGKCISAEEQIYVLTSIFIHVSVQY